MLYIGPYLKLTGKTAPVSVERWGCTNVACERPYRVSPSKHVAPTSLGAFCPGCGHTCQPFLLSEDRLVDPIEVMRGDALGTAYTSGYGVTRTHYLTPNAPRNFPRRFHIEETQDMLCIDMHEEIRWFRNAYAQEITLLMATFSEVSFHWGYVASS